MRASTAPGSVIDVVHLRKTFQRLTEAALLYNATVPRLAPPVRNVRASTVGMPRPDISDVTDAFSITPRDARKKNDGFLFSMDVTAAPVVGGSKPKPVRNVREDEFELVTTWERLAEIAEIILDAGSVALDIETFGPGKRGGLDPWHGDIRLLSLCVSGHIPLLIDLQATGYELGPIKDALEMIEVVGHNVKFDALWLRVKCGLRLRRLYCTMTAARLLGAGAEPEQKNSLDAVLERFLSVDFGEDLSVSDWALPELTHEQLAYAVKDITMLDELRARLHAEITTAGMEAVVETEMQLLPVVVEMEFNGIPVDLDRVAGFLDQANADLITHEKRIGEALDDFTINPKSPKALLAKLQQRGLQVSGTGEAALAPHRALPEVRALLDFRAAGNRRQQLEKLRDAAQGDRRVHCRFNPTGTDTGRFTSTEPNMQNLGRGDLRTCVAAPDGKCLVIGDYAQIELRAAAVLAGEGSMIQAYRDGADLHRKTAAAVLGKSVDKVEKEDRQLAKAVNFGLLFGQNPPGLTRYAETAYGVTMSLEEAERYRSSFFNTYPALGKWHAQARRRAGDLGVKEVRTRAGRRRLLPATGKDNWWKRFTTLVNTPVQGTCAEGLKRAMIELHRSLPTGARLVNTVHEELVVECEVQHAQGIQKLLHDTMVREMTVIFPEIPIEVDAKVCRTWADKG